jgi:hypothetical protein
LNLFANCFSPLNSEIKIGSKPVLYQHWAKADVFFINDLSQNEGGFLSLEQFPNKYGIISNFLEYLYNGLLKAIPMTFKEVIAVNNKLEKVCDRYVTVLNNTLKPTKPFKTGFLPILISEFSQSGWLKISSGAVDGLSQYLHNVK